MLFVSDPNCYPQKAPSDVRVISPKGFGVRVSEIKLVRFIPFDTLSIQGLLVDYVDDPSKANGLKLGIETPTFCASQDLYIGGMTADAAKTIYRTIIEKKFYDFSKFAYQKAKKTKDLDLTSSNLFFSNETTSLRVVTISGIFGAFESMVNLNDSLCSNVNEVACEDEFETEYVNECEDEFEDDDDVTFDINDTEGLPYHD